MADYLWEQRERAEQKERFMSQRRDKTLFNSQKEQTRRWKITQVNYFIFHILNIINNAVNKQFEFQMKQGQYSEIGNSRYQLMTSVSMPVYDLRHNEVRICFSYFGIYLIS